MPEIVQCPQCSQKLRVPDDMQGQKVKCPKCMTNFWSAGEAPSRNGPSMSTSSGGVRSGVATPPAPRRAPGRADDEDDRDEDLPRGGGGPKARQKEGWRKVRLGISLITYALY